MSLCRTSSLNTQEKKSTTDINITYTVPSNIQIFKIKLRQDNVSEKELKKKNYRKCYSINKEYDDAECDTFTIFILNQCFVNVGYGKAGYFLVLESNRNDRE